MARRQADAYPLRSAAVYESWAGLNTQERSERTANARRGFDDKFLEQARELAAAKGVEFTPEDIAASAERLRKAHFKRLSARSVAVRQARSLKSRIPPEGPEQ